MTYDFNNYKNDAISKPRDLAWTNWASFPKVGDSVQGYIKDVFFRKSEGDFKEQRGITLEQTNGELINVGIKHIDFVLAKTDNLRLGDPLTIVLEKEIPATTKGHSPTKQFAFYGTTLPENADSPTVLQLENEDRKVAMDEEAKANAEFNGEDILAPKPEAPAQPAAISGPPKAPAVAQTTAPETPIAPVNNAPVTPEAPVA